MFVTWKTYQRRGRRRPGTTTRAVLVQSYRDGNGTPRHRPIATLATYGEKRGPRTMEGTCCSFWDRAFEQLASLKIEGEARTAIIAALAKRVPMPSPAELDEWRRGRDQFYAAVRRVLGAAA